MDELSDTKIRNAAPLAKEYAIADGQGLSVVVRPNGTKLWLYRYRFGGKRKNMSLGTFPTVGLKAAREKRHDAEKLLDQALDPVAVREANRQEDEKLKHTFRAVGEEWAKAKLEKENKAKATIKRARWNLAQLYRELVVHHNDFDVLIPSHSRMGKFSGGKRISMLRGTPGRRRIKPLRSRVTIIWWTDGGLTRKWRWMSASTGGCPNMYE